MQRTWTIDPARTRVTVAAESTLHAARSHCTGVTGTLCGDPDALESTAAGTVEVPLHAMSFGDRVRDFAMRRHIDTRRWPDARFVVSAVTVLCKNPWRLRVRGEVEYHGQSFPLEVEADGYLSDAELVAHGRFALRLSDMGIARPKLLFLKVADAVDVEVSIVAKGSP